MIGINVRNDKHLRYADLIVRGTKTLESRKSDSLRPYVGKRVAIVRTGDGVAVAIGEVTVGEPVIVDEAEFRRLEQQHLVPAGSAYDILPGGTKHLYPMLDPVEYSTPKRVGRGIVARQVLEV